MALDTVAIEKPVSFAISKIFINHWQRIPSTNMMGRIAVHSFQQINDDPVDHLIVFVSYQFLNLIV